MIHTTGFKITYYGDPDVGNFSAQWTLEGQFTFDSKEELDIFKERIADLYELQCDERVGVDTIDEYNDRINSEIAETFSGDYTWE